MPDKDFFTEATRLEAWTHLAGDGAAARARSTGLRRTRYAGIAAGTSAVAVGVVAIAATFGVGAGGGGAADAGGLGGPALSAGAHGPMTTPTKQAPAKGTMGALFEQWKTCPDSELTVKNSLPQDPPNLQQAWRDACHRDVATLSALLPDYDVTPAVSGYGLPHGAPANALPPTYFDIPASVIPAGYTPNMGPSLYRIVGKDGVTSKVIIRAYGHDDETKPLTGEAITLPNGLRGWLTLGTDVTKGRPGYEIYILSHGKTFYMYATGQPNYDFKALVTSPQFADMAAEALAEPES